MWTETLLGWIVIGLALYLPSTAVIAGAMAILRAVRPGVTLPKPMIRVLNVALSVALFYGIPILVHARFGRAEH